MKGRKLADLRERWVSVTYAAMGSSDESADYGQGLHPGERRLAPYAANAVASRGRRFVEAECPMRSPFQRDRDRVLHATAFRRLTHKTQVFIYHEGDHFRTRLTHSLEVAQIARTISRQLRLDEDLAEVLALAHDLGHSPFGHAGEKSLDQAMTDFGGFDHNAQSLRVVTRLERKYASFDGLNLTWETLEGLAKHNGPLLGPAHAAVGRVLEDLEDWQSFDRQQWASAEAQVAALADDIAYLSHDVDDGLRAGLLTLADFAGVPLAGPAVEQARAARGAGDDVRTIFEVTRRMITVMVADVVAQSRRHLAGVRPASPEDIRRWEGPAVAFSPAMDRDMRALKAFLFERVYHHPRVLKTMTSARQIVADLFQRYMAEPEQLPGRWRDEMRAADLPKRARLIADFVAGQTDRYAIAEHARLFDATPDLR